MRLVVDTQSFWRRLALFAYRRWATSQEPGGRKPVGVPGNRDPDNPCEHYAPRRLMPGEWNDCMSDGHYLCRECCHKSPVKLEGWVNRDE